jgi:tRNA A37 threonylcarbamoyladenosine synthetase subunit TsaC/SUA5/YrdC
VVISPSIPLHEPTRTGTGMSLSRPLARSTPATTIAQAREQLGDAVQVYLDAGPTAAAVASTIVDATVSPPRLLRRGAVGLAELRDVVPDIEEIP